MTRLAASEAARAAQENGRVHRPSRDGLTIEQAVAIESPREFRLSPDGRRVAFTAEEAGARQIFVMASRGGYPEQVTATEKPATARRAGSPTAIRSRSSRGAAAGISCGSWTRRSRAAAARRPAPARPNLSR